VVDQPESIRIIRAVFAGTCTVPDERCQPFLLVGSESKGEPLHCPFCKGPIVGEWHIPRIALELSIPSLPLGKRNGA
jgi:hypothetical protein